MRMFSKLLLLCLAAQFLFFCKKKETSWDIDGAFPIAKSHLNLTNFIGDSIFKADNTGLLHIAFTKKLLSYTMDSIAKLPDTTIKVNYISFFATSLAPNTTIYTNANSTTDKEITFNLSNGVELNKADVRTGNLIIDFKNTYTQPLRFQYEIVSASIWGNSLKIDEVIPAGSTSNPTIISKTYSLNNYNISFTGINQNKVNTLVQTYTISTDGSGASDNLLAGQGLVANMNFKKIVPEYIQGYLGNQKLTQITDSQSLNLFSNFKPSNLSLTQAAINFRIINEFGVEITSSIKNLKSIKKTPYTVVNLNSGGMLQAININRAGKTNNASNPVFPFVKQINLNTNNSNINSFLENLPDLLGYTMNAELNPLGNISAGNDFAYYGHGLNVFADVDIPMQLSSSSFYLQSYSSLNLANSEALTNVNTCDIILQARNNYPFKAVLQGYLVNEQNVITDSLFTASQNLIQSALVDGNNTVLNYTDTQLTVSLDKNKIEKLKATKQIKFVIQLFLPNQPTPVKLTDTSYLDITLKAIVNYKVRIK